MGWDGREAAVSFILDWNPASNETGLSTATAAADDAVAAAPGPQSVEAGDSCDPMTPAKAPAARRDDDDFDDTAVAAERARREEREQQEKGREALLRLGIFLEKHEVQEDTVDVLSSAGWL